MMDALNVETASEAELDYWGRKGERSKLCYPFDPLEMTPIRDKGKYWLIKGIIARGETSAWVAPPGAMKSALMAQLAMCVANFKDWNGLKHKNHGSVLYFALERQDLVRRRLWAHHPTMAMENGCDVSVVSGMVDLSTFEGMNRVIATIDAAGHEMGGPVGLLIFDTFAKLVSAGGLDENKAADQGKIFANLQRLKDRLNCKIGAPHIALVGHTGKDETKGARGSNAFYGDVDIMVEITGSGDTRTASITKANDLPEGPLFSFKSEVHTFGTDEDGDPITVNIVSSEEVSFQSETKSSEPKLSGQNQKLLFRILHDAGADGLTLEDWNTQAREAGVTRKATLTEARYALTDKKMVREYGGRWKVNHD